MVCKEVMLQAKWGSQKPDPRIAEAFPGALLVETAAATVCADDANWLYRDGSDHWDEGHRIANAAAR